VWAGSVEWGVSGGPAAKNFGGAGGQPKRQHAKKRLLTWNIQYAFSVIDYTCMTCQEVQK